ncbi:MAG: NfeD family protein [Coraliomargarita sp.]
MVIAGLILATLVLTALEVFLPGGVLGVAACVCLVVASYLSYESFGLFTATMVFFGTVLAALVLAILQFRYLIKTPVGQKLFLRNTVDGHSNETSGSDDIVGKTGQALTRLNPTGMVTIDGKQFEAHSEDGFIEQNQSVRVVARDSFKLIIQKS